MPNFSGLRKEIIENNYLDYIDAKETMSDRNKAVVIKYTRGYPYRELAKEYNVSCNRIHKIVFNFVTYTRKVIQQEKKAAQSGKEE